jgi:hypothetical protein
MKKYSKIQNNNDKLFVLLFLKSKNIKINLPITDKDVAVYEIAFKLSLIIVYKNR